MEDDITLIFIFFTTDHQQSTALLDLIITSRNWVTEEPSGTQVPTKENIFQLAGERHVLTAGVPIFSKTNPLLDASRWAMWFYEQTEN